MSFAEQAGIFAPIITAERSPCSYLFLWELRCRVCQVMNICTRQSVKLEAGEARMPSLGAIRPEAALSELWRYLDRLCVHHSVAPEKVSHAVADSPDFPWPSR